MAIPKNISFVTFDVYGTLIDWDAGVFDAPATKQAAKLLADWGAAGPTLVLLSEAEAAAGKSFRNLRRLAVMPVADAGVADVLGAASLLISEAALPELTARAAGTATTDTEQS